MTERVLIADDHAPTRASIRTILGADGRFAVCGEAADAAGAVQLALREQPDLCLLDVRMPGSGLAACWEIAARLRHTAIVMLTVSDLDQDLFASLRAGARGYLLKDSDSALIPDALWGVLQGEAVVPGPLLARVVAQFRDPNPKWRKPSEAAEGPRLTSREWEILELLQAGLTTREIAKRLSVTRATVRSHRAQVTRKLRERDLTGVVTTDG